MRQRDFVEDERMLRVAGHRLNVHLAHEAEKKAQEALESAEQHFRARVELLNERMRKVMKGTVSAMFLSVLALAAVL